MVGRVFGTYLHGPVLARNSPWPTCCSGGPCPRRAPPGGARAVGRRGGGAPSGAERLAAVDGTRRAGSPASAADRGSVSACRGRPATVLAPRAGLRGTTRCRPGLSRSVLGHSAGRRPVAERGRGRAHDRRHGGGVGALQRRGGPGRRLPAGRPPVGAGLVGQGGHRRLDAGPEAAGVLALVGPERGAEGDGGAGAAQPLAPLGAGCAGCRRGGPAPPGGRYAPPGRRRRPGRPGPSRRGSGRPRGR